MSKLEKDLRFLKKNVFLVADFFIDLCVHRFRLFELILSALIGGL